MAAGLHKLVGSGGLTFQAAQHIPGPDDSRAGGAGRPADEFTTDPAELFDLVRSKSRPQVHPPRAPGRQQASQSHTAQRRAHVSFLEPDS